ncbi:ATP-binding protein [Pseudomonas viridiflava]|uniref:ATP-binding protein n=1 Tax=Pseudomonas viridiflava TaxID=33069 RepID=UPI000F053110|nr:ATP-binding protein [Pseudomonas viridiflava]
MIIESLQVKDLHNYITGTTKLKPGLNIIFGKNGSGKTTALNIIRAILNLDVDYIQNLQFLEIKINFVDEEKKGLIKISKHKDNHIVQINELSAPLPSISALVKGEKESAVIRSIMEGLKSDIKKSKPLDDAIAIKKEFDRIKANTSITLVNIDRTIKVTSNSGDVSFDNAWSLKILTEKPLAEKTPLDHVQSYCIENHRELTKNLATIKTEFINGLMVKFLDLRVSELSQDQVNVKIDDISKLEQRLRELEIYKDQGPAKVLAKFFKDTKKILEAQSSSVKKIKAGRRTAKEEMDIIVKNISFARIESLLASIQEMDEKIEESNALTKRYLKTVNNFFADSGKEILFSKVDGQLRFKFISYEGSDNSQERGVNELSSGERQIIIVLSYLYFVAKKGSIFIIDEPELSLHLAWQKEFVSAMLKLAPENCQIILASHSPEIVGPYRDAVSRVFGDIREE